MQQEQEWSEVQTEKPEKEKIEFEVEKDEPKKEEVKQEVKAPEPEVKKEEPKELEGINTKGAEKRIRQLVRQRKEREEEVEQLLETNRKLSETLKKKEEEVFNVSKNSLEASEKQLTDKIDLARQAYLEAFDEGDKERVLKAQEMLNDAQSDLKNVTSVKSRYSEEYSEPVRQEAPAPAPRRRDRRAEEWAANNEWFGKDNVMTAAALAIDADLKEQGYDPDDEDFYDEVNNRIQEAFPHKFGEVQERVQENTNKPAQVVSGASRSSPNSGRKIKLSKEDVNLANKWGIPLEKYAAEKLKVTSADGEYTDIN